MSYFNFIKLHITNKKLCVIQELSSGTLLNIVYLYVFITATLPVASHDHIAIEGIHVTSLL